MKLMTFVAPDGQQHIGALQSNGTHVVDFTASDPSPAFRDMLGLIDGGPEALAKARAMLASAKVTHALSAIKVMAPIPQPRRLRDYLCFEKHVRQSRANRYLFGQGTARLDPATVEIPKAWYQKPVYYKGNVFSVVGPDTDVHWPKYSQTIDYELEIAIVTSRHGKDVPKGSGLQYVFGYMVFNDFSARDAQYIEMQTGLGPAKGKDFDTGNAMGPWLVTADEIPNPQNLTMIARINGEEWSRGNTSEMQHTFDDMVTYGSADETFYAGEVLGSGTVGGGCGNELGRFMKHGDVIELEVIGLGVLRNRIVAPHVLQPPTFPIRILG
jgi:2-keto-4-pentenoate hydratase/2-oxohepta-3-ene-1,7-dioic acid hydratase in catechol pathway